MTSTELNYVKTGGDIYCDDTGRHIKGMNIMEEKLKLERSFSEEYRELYCQLHESISDLVWYIRQQSIPNDQNRTKKKQKKKK